MNLYKHQAEIVEKDPKKCGLWLGTGSGKTITALSLAKGKTLVITPKTVRDDKVWQKNLEKIDKELDITVISKEDFRLSKFVAMKYDTIIIDEAHQVAGATPQIRWVNREAIPKCSQLFDKLIDFLSKYHPKRLYLLTATPIRTPMVVWGLARILGRDWNFYTFRDAFYFPVKKGFREFWIVKNDSETKKRLGQAVQKLGYTGRLDDYFDVPDQIYREQRVELTAEQKNVLKEIMIDFPDPLVLIGKKHQVENGVLKGDEFSDNRTIKDNKIEALKDLALEFPKLVIIAKYTQQIDKIQSEMSTVCPQVLILDGRTKNREEIIKRAEDSEECILIVQAQVSSGYELPSFPVMVFASMSYSVVDRLQAEGRILRANALKKNLYITLIAKGGVDEAVSKSITNKVDFNEKIYAEEGSTISN